MPETVIFNDPTGEGKPIELKAFEVDGSLPDSDQRRAKIPEPDPHYVDLGMLYRLAAIEKVRRSGVTDTPLPLRCAGTWAPARTTTSSSSPPA